MDPVQFYKEIARSRGWIYEGAGVWKDSTGKRLGATQSQTGTSGVSGSNVNDGVNGSGSSNSSSSSVGQMNMIVPQGPNAPGELNRNIKQISFVRSEKDKARLYVRQPKKAVVERNEKAKNLDFLIQLLGRRPEDAVEKSIWDSYRDRFAVNTIKQHQRWSGHYDRVFMMLNKQYEANGKEIPLETKSFRALAW